MTVTWDKDHADELLKYFNAKVVYTESQVRSGWSAVWEHGSMDFGGTKEQEKEYRIVGSLFCFLWQEKKIPADLAMELAVSWGRVNLNLTDQDKCVAIVKRTLQLANEGKAVKIEDDFGKFTATVCVGHAHTHVGIPGSDGSFTQYVENLFNVLHGGPGLSFVS